MERGVMPRRNPLLPDSFCHAEGITIFFRNRSQFALRKAFMKATSFSTPSIGMAL